VGKFKADPTDPVASEAGWNRRQRRVKEVTRLQEKLTRLREELEVVEEHYNEAVEAIKLTEQVLQLEKIRADAAWARVVELETQPPDDTVNAP
jgi:uncharacterized protein involved in exopolysaccharide biosynthesis